MDDNVAAVMKKNVAMEEAIGSLENSAAVFQSGLKGEPLDETMSGVDDVVDMIMNFK